MVYCLLPSYTLDKQVCVRPLLLEAMASSQKFLLCVIIMTQYWQTWVTSFKNILIQTDLGFTVQQRKMLTRAPSLI